MNVDKTVEHILDLAPYNEVQARSTSSQNLLYILPIHDLHTMAKLWLLYADIHKHLSAYHRELYNNHDLDNVKVGFLLDKLSTLKNSEE